MIILTILLTSGLFFWADSQEIYVPQYYEYSEISAFDTSFSVVKIFPENMGKIQTFYKNSEKTSHSQKISDIKNLEFATNGGIFSPSFEPMGLYVENSQIIKPLNIENGEGNCFLKPNGVFFIENSHAKIVQTSDFNYSKDVSLAIQSGPLLLNNNEIHPDFNSDSKNKYVRNGVGVNKKGEVFFIISQDPVTLYQFASFFKNNLSCHSALYLDGFISQLYTKKYQNNLFESLYHKPSPEPFSVIIAIIGEGE